MSFLLLFIVQRFSFHLLLSFKPPHFYPVLFRKRGKRYNCQADGGHVGRVLQQRGNDSQVL